MKLTNLKGQTKEQLQELLSTCSEYDTKDLLEQTEYYLLCYPQGTGDEQLEELLETMYDLLVPEE